MMVNILCLEAIEMKIIASIALLGARSACLPVFRYTSDNSCHSIILIYIYYIGVERSNGTPTGTSCLYWELNASV